MPKHEFAQFIQLPELKIIAFRNPRKLHWEFDPVKESLFEVCPLSVPINPLLGLPQDSS